MCPVMEGWDSFNVVKKASADGISGTMATGAVVLLKANIRCFELSEV